MYNPCIRFHILNGVAIIPDCTIRHCNSIAQIFLCIVTRMRCNNDLLSNYFRKLVSDEIGAILSRTAKTNKVTLVDSIGARKIIKARVKNRRNFTLVERINLFMIVCNTNLFLVKDCLRTYKELTAGRVDAPYNCGSTVNLNAESPSTIEPIKNSKIAREDLIFRVFEVNVFHALSIARIGAEIKGSCDSLPTVPHFCIPTVTNSTAAIIILCSHNVIVFAVFIIRIRLRVRFTVGKRCGNH